MAYNQSLSNAEQAVADFKAQKIRVSALASTLRGETTLLNALPPVFTQALEGVLERLEAGALFTEESCSFSQTATPRAIMATIKRHVTLVT